MHIELSDDEALVLFELLADYAKNEDGRRLQIRYAAERNALWALHSALENTLVVPFQPDYGEQLENARARLEERGGSW